MSISYNWQVTNTDYLTADGFVYQAHWTCYAVDGEFSASAYATVGWPEGTPTIAYEDLTQATVLEWVWESIDKTATETSLAAQIALLKNPIKASGTPWGQA
jgi:hypothetical protein